MISNKIIPVMRFNLWIFLTSVFIILTATSCKRNFIEIIPVDRVAKDGFFKTTNDLVFATNGAYAAQRSTYTTGDGYGNCHFVLNECRSDNTLQDPTDQAERWATSRFAETTGNIPLLSVWRDYYNTINLANAVIDRGPGVTAGDQNLIKRLIAEAKFLRACSYFELVMNWGDVPLRIKETTNFTGAITARSPVADVYAQIIKDLTEAMAVLPPVYDNSTNNEKGRATKWAALALSGKVYLQKGDKTNAAKAFRSVIAEGGYSLLTNYADLWNAGNYNHAESIYEISFGQANNTGNNFVGRFIPVNSTATLGINASGNSKPIRPTQNLVNAYEAGDLRKDASIKTDANGQPFIAKYIDYTATDALGGRNSWPLIRYADVLLGLAEALGETEEAYTYINQVRSRAKRPAISAATAGTFTEKLGKERRIEFAFEAQRWHDLLRLPPDQVIAIINAEKPADYPGNFINIDKHHLLFPIPGQEIQPGGGVVTQNEGYEK